MREFKRPLGGSFWTLNHRRTLLLIVLFSLVSSLGATVSTKLEAHLSQHGVRGVITFSQAQDQGPITISANISVAKEYKGEYSWGIYEFPIDYSLPDYCHSRMLGRKPIINLDTTLNKLVLDNTEASEDAAELEEGTAPAEPDTIQIYKEFTSSAVGLIGKDAIWGRSLVLEGPSRSRICATVTPKIGEHQVKAAEARFTSPVAGSVWFNTLSRGDSVETKIFTNLVHVAGQVKSSSHKWQIFITDVLDTDDDIQGKTCDFLQILYDPANKNGDGCSEQEPAKCREGDLTGKFGTVRVGRRESMFTKSHFTDLNLELPELEGRARSLFLVLYDEEHPETYLACSKIRDIKPRVAKAEFGHEGMQGAITFTQVSPFHPVHSQIRLTGLEEGASSYHVHSLPVTMSKRDAEDNPCTRTGGHFNPFHMDASASPAEGSFDLYEVGDLSGKYGKLQGFKEAAISAVDPSLTLFGKLSIIGRSVVIHRSPVPKRWTCANILLSGRQLITAVATFTYPVAGRIIFRQPEDDQYADTSVYVESLIYSDGSKNDTFDHKWHVHNILPGRDYFNWTGRCLSTGGHFNPYKISLDSSIYSECVNEHAFFRCEVGDLYNKHEALRVVGRKRDAKNTAKFFTDTNLPLTGPHSIIGRSITIHDDHAPEHRGNRMACTGISRTFRHKAVARRWFGNGHTPPIKGRLEFIQDTTLDATHTLVDLHGMNGVANAYHVHQISIQDHLAFPCTGEAVGGHFNPYQWDPSESPKPGKGTNDQYEVGDLSGKHGLLADMQDIRSIYNDTNLPLFGYNSIIGRSIVIHKRHRGERWACASIGWGFDPDEAREVRAIASFHHPNGFAWGYIRMSQVVYNDGSTTDTTLEVRLKYPGKLNTDVTHGHEWSVYVNPVGHDATVKWASARCTAAGYRWNPTHIQLADPNDRNFYGEECGSDYPLRCEVGDMSGRHGRISVGGKAYVVNDPNLPLEGVDWFTSAIGKSLVIHGPNGDTNRMACANIEAERHIVKVASIRTKSRFNLATFIEEVQAAMGIPEWFLYIDARKTRKLHNGRCVQIELHFAGPYAHKLEQDFGRLMRTGKQERPSIPIPGFNPDPRRKTKLGYKECDSDKGNKPTSPYYKNDLYFSSATSQQLLSSHGIMMVLTSIAILVVMH